MEEKRKGRGDFTKAVCKKNDCVTLEITDMGEEGQGIGHFEGYTLFIKDALVGDIVQACVIKVKKHFGYARLEDIIVPSPYRTEPVCPVARQCGGCQLQHCSYGMQLQWKEEKVRNCLNRIGGFCIERSQIGTFSVEKGTSTMSDRNMDEKTIVMEPILFMDEPYHYRNKAQFPVGMDKQGNLVAGFYAGRTHHIIENTDCAIQHYCNRTIVEIVLGFMKEFGIAAYNEKEHTGLVRHILTRIGVHTGEVMVCLVINGISLPRSRKLVERLCSVPLLGADAGQCFYVKSICLNYNMEKTNVVLGQEIKVLYGNGYMEDTIGDLVYRISPLSFYQVNPIQTKKLYDVVLEYADLHGGEVVWDLYCGIGTISLFLAQKAAKVYGVEIVPQAVADACVNAHLNRLDNVTFFAGAAEEVVPEQYQKSGNRLRADVVVLDPPRKGCGKELLQTVAWMQPKSIVYVSCNPATLARDLRYLCNADYVIRRVRTCDMFCQTKHVETIVKLVRK